MACVYFLSFPRVAQSNGGTAPPFLIATRIEIAARPTPHLSKVLPYLFDFHEQCQGTTLTDETVKTEYAGIEIEQRLFAKRVSHQDWKMNAGFPREGFST